MEEVRDKGKRIEIIEIWKGVSDTEGQNLKQRKIK